MKASGMWGEEVFQDGRINFKKREEPKKIPSS